MSGNRNLIKMGLVSMLIAGSCGLQAEAPVLEKAHIEQFISACKHFDCFWKEILSNNKGDRFQLLQKLNNNTVQPLTDLQNNIPNVPPANAKFKAMVIDLCDAVKNIHEKFSTAKSITQLKASATTDCTLQTVLEKARKDLDELISYIDIHPEAYTPEAANLLKDFRKTTFQKIYNDLHATTMGHLLAALVKYLPYF